MSIGLSMGSTSFVTPSADLITRFLNKDRGLWQEQGLPEDIATHWLGWLDADQWLETHFNDLQSWAQQTIKQNRFSQIVLLGMGGSSMAARVLFECMHRNPDFPPLLVLDTSSPDQVNHHDIDVESTLFIVSSKSGTTIEVLSLLFYFYAEVEKISASPGEQFIAITDQATWLHHHAQEKQFRRIFIGEKDVGGRYSALSYYGLVPCVLSGVQFDEFIDGVQNFYRQLRTPETQQEVMVLASRMAEHIFSGEYKIKFFIDPAIATFFIWVEQLIAESTGKQGKGLLPIVSNDCIDSGVHKGTNNGTDTISIDIAIASNESLVTSDNKITAINHSLYKQVLSSTNEFGALFLYWQMVVATACLMAKINPFDQPDVELSKQQSKLFLKHKSDLSFLTSVFENNQYVLYMSSEAIVIDTGQSAPFVKRVLDVTENYLSILTYLPEIPEVDAKIVKFVSSLNTQGYTVTNGYGPRYLHSVGQMHKGGPDEGVFLQIIERHSPQIAIPGKNYTLSDVYCAQADGDLEVLHRLGRRVMRVELKADRLQSLEQLIKDFTA